jgi:hypothetical protein
MINIISFLHFVTEEVPAIEILGIVVLKAKDVIHKISLYIYVEVYEF